MRLTAVPHLHSFHIPVMGLGYTIDTPLKVARFGISSVVSIIEDGLVERMRELHCAREGEPYVPVPAADVDHRARRITEYLNLLHRTVTRQLGALRTQPFGPGTEIDRYFTLLPASPERTLFDRMQALPPGAERARLEDELRDRIVAGAIDVNIMTKCDRPNFDAAGAPLPDEYADARAALRGFAQSELHGAVVFSAGLNPRLYTYCASFADFFPDAGGRLRKTITLKVSDYRSASVQGRFLAKKGLWVSEFRVESGLNCGGHAFATDGLLLGPILEEFRSRRAELAAELFALWRRALAQKGQAVPDAAPPIRLTVQGGVGTAEEHVFLREHYGVDSVGWGSPFLLVPEATNVDAETLAALVAATPDDYFLSDASPLGVPINNFRRSSSERQRRQRIDARRPGSPCFKKFLAFNTEFTEAPICTASRQYQHLKLRELAARPPAENGDAAGAANAAITDKECLCEGLGASALLAHGVAPAHGLSAVAICPGPNLAFFSRVCSLGQMVDHIYGRGSVLNRVVRPHMFVNELRLYVAYLERMLTRAAGIGGACELDTFRSNLLAGIAYYKTLDVPGLADGVAALERPLEALAIPAGAS